MWFKELKELRIAIGMPAKELAEKVGKSATYISRIESGSILNTSFDLVSSIARVIAENEKVKSGEIDLDKYSSDFSKLVLSYRYESMKSVYDYVKENKNVEEYSNIMKCLNKEDINLFEVVGRYRMAEEKFNKAKERFKEVILLNTGNKNFKDVMKNIKKDGYKIQFEVKIDADDVMDKGYEEFMNIISDEISFKAEIVKQLGIEGVVRDNSEYSFNEEEGEIILEKPEL